MRALATPQAAVEPQATLPKSARLTAAAIAAVVVASWVPIAIGATTRSAAGWVVAVVLMLAVERLTNRLTPAVVVTGFVLSSGLVASGLVTDPTRYMSVAVTGGAVALRFGLTVWRSHDLHLSTPRPVMLAVGGYLVWAALAAITSINHRVSAEYLAGMIVVCGMAFWAIPSMLADADDRDYLIAGVGVLAVLVAISVYFIAIAGPVNVFGRSIGDVQLADLTVAGHPTGLLFLRSSGIYLAPLEAGITMALATSLLLGWSLRGTPPRRLLFWAALAFMAPAILLTLDRTSWLTVIVASAAFALLASRAHFPVRPAVVVCTLFTVLFLAVLVGAVGANAVASTCTSNCAQASGGDETTLRGGTGLSGREYLWKASVYAIEKRPILGVGPGNDVPALDPYLGGGGQHIQNLTSHSTWLRTAVEMGVPGLLFLASTLVAVAWTVFGTPRRRGTPDPGQLALVAALFGLLTGATFESFLLGGVTFSSLLLTVGLGLVAVPATRNVLSTRTASPEPA
jgi:O-antigen ligase